jgi:hypothetical protein
LIRICQQLRPPPIALGAVALEAERVVTVGADATAKLEPGFAFLAAVAGPASSF